MNRKDYRRIVKIMKATWKLPHNMDGKTCDEALLIQLRNLVGLSKEDYSSIINLFIKVDYILDKEMRLLRAKDDWTIFNTFNPNRDRYFGGINEKR